jgi:hypothetical protein
MLEKRTMGYVDFSYPDQEAAAVPVIFNTDTQKVELYFDVSCEDWYAAKECDHFYDTVEQAEEALKDRKRELIAKMPEVKEYLETMTRWDDEGEDSPFHFEREDYLEHSLYYCKYKRDGSWLEKENEELKTENKYLMDIVHTGFMNIYGYSFKVEDVQAVRWGEKKAELVLKDGRDIKTCNKEEFNIVKNLFGRNVSSCTYTHLDVKGEDED